MDKNDGRRSFIKKVGIGSLSAAVLPGAAFPASESTKKDRSANAAPITQPGKRRYNEAYTDQYLNRVAFPIGGFGTGMFCIEGTGAISHMSVRHQPDLFNEPPMFAALAIKGLKNGAKVIEGPVPDWKKFGDRGAGNGSGGSTYGLPRFQRARFMPRFPFGNIDLEDGDIPVQAKITAWNPFIPNDPDHSSLPVAGLEYQFHNNGSVPIDAVFSYNAKNFLKENDGHNLIRKIANGFVLSERGTTEKPHLRSDFAILTDQDNVVVDYCWFRGGWWDPMTMAWNAVRNAEVKSVDPVDEGAPGASLFVPFSLGPGAIKIIKVFVAWYVPDSDLRYGNDPEPEECDPASGCCNSPSDAGLNQYYKDFKSEQYKPWYSSRFGSVDEVADYFVRNYEMLNKQSSLFSEAFYASTLPPEVMEAVAANLTILKSPTVMRQYNGRLWNYEGCGDNWGCCHGSCTHVWNYAQAIPHLFPSLERSLRHTEFCEDQSAVGHQTFRASLPIRPTDHGFHPAADGQLGGIMKVYREWRISGDQDWLRKIYPMVKVSMDYCINLWDPRSKGVVEEPHHNTYDIEFWGPDGMCTSFYLGALEAMVRMGSFLKHNVASYRKLLDKGRKYMERELFNGAYFIQKIEMSGLKAGNPIEASQKSMGGEYSQEAKELLEKEGPKYQYGDGCLSDGVLGAWIASMCGLDDPIDRGKIKSHLMAVHQYNLKDNLSDHANPQRPSYALGNEAGLLLCSWPKGGKLSLPFVYSDEVWTGIEYQVASHLMLVGQVEEGLEIVRACRDRYDGRVRNPFNEYECGSWYARALSSYGLLQGLTGIRYDAVDKILYIDSRIGDFTSFISTETGFGNVTLRNGKPYLKVASGDIPVRSAMVSGKKVELEKT
jgi:uncharacterized protein (DUF608 family)